MPQSKFDERKLLVVAAAVAFAGLFAVLLKKLLNLPDKTEPKLKGGKMHPYLFLPKKTIEKYLASGAKKMRFKFVEDKQRVKLHLEGYDEQDKQCFNKKIDTIYPPGKDAELENKEFGYFEAEHGGTWLHDTFTQQPLKDWELKPVECDLPGGKGYVSYEMTGSSMLLAMRINPCPPGCRPPVIN